MPPEKAAQVIGMLLGVQVSAGWVDKAASRLARQLARAGFEDAMEAALAAEDALAADETPVSVLGKGSIMLLRVQPGDFSTRFATPSMGNGREAPSTGRSLQCQDGRDGLLH